MIIDFIYTIKKSLKIISSCLFCRSQIIKSDGNSTTVDTPNILTGDAYVEVWISWDGGVIRFGQGSVICKLSWFKSAVIFSFPNTARCVPFHVILWFKSRCTFNATFLFFLFRKEVKHWKA